MTAPRRSLLHNPDFVRLWTAETISQFGSQVSALAIPLIAATVLKVTPLEFGLLGTIEFLPFILLSLPAGVWDKLPQYKDWRNYNRLQGEIRALYELIQTGKRSYFD
jgi:hypothetical protein